MKTHTPLQRRLRKVDIILLFSLIGISIFCTIAIYSATITRTGLQNTYIKEIIWQVLSYIVMIAVMLFNYRALKKTIPWAGYVLSLVLLLVVFAFPSVNGSHSWIIISGFQIQPSEFAKLFIIMVISSYMEKAKEKNESFGWKHFGFIMLIVGVPFALILKQPALGQALVLLGIVGSMMILFLEKRQFILFLVIGFILGSSLFLAKAVFPDQSIHFIDKLPIKSYQKGRLVTFISPEALQKGAGYQVTQAKIAVGSGGLLGEGLLKGTQTQGNWIPEQWTDFIFSAIAEQFGFIGSSILIFLFFLLLQRMILVATHAADYFSSYFIAGVVGMFSFQIFENIGMNLSIMPVAGITLPFVSYGGSSLLTNFVLVGIVLSMEIWRNPLTF